MARALIVLGVLGAVSGGFVRAAKADNGVPAISQYVEAMPTAGSPTPPARPHAHGKTSTTGKTGANGGAASVTPAVAARVAKVGGADKRALLNLAATAPPVIKEAANARFVAPSRRSAFSVLASSGGTPVVLVALGALASVILAGALAGARRSRLLTRS